MMECEARDYIQSHLKPRHEPHFNGQYVNIVMDEIAQQFTLKYTEVGFRMCILNLKEAEALLKEVRKAEFKLLKL